MTFEWDTTKAESNLRKHGVDFNAAIRIFEDATLEREDTRREYQEERMLAVGRVEDDCFFVVYVWRGEVRRIISARGANRHEREAYRQAFPPREGQDRLGTPSESDR